jgi:chromosome segregation ATPase
MFNKNEKVDTRVAILEEKFSVYEQMLTKIEDAIRAISETSQGISKMLAIHEERIEVSHKTDDSILVKLKEVEQKNNTEHGKVIKKIEGLETKIEDLSKARWMAVGIIGFVALLVTAVSTLASGVIIPPTSTPSDTNIVK